MSFGGPFWRPFGVMDRSLYSSREAQTPRDTIHIEQYYNRTIDIQTSPCLTRLVTPSGVGGFKN